MKFYDGVSRGKIFEELSSLRREVPGDDLRSIGVGIGLQIAMNVVQSQMAEGMWHDPEDERYKIPEGTMLNLEITRGTLQAVETGWWDGEAWKKVSGDIPSEWVTGWMMMPEPRKEKQYD